MRLPALGLIMLAVLALAACSSSPKPSTSGSTSPGSSSPGSSSPGSSSPTTPAPGTPSSATPASPTATAPTSSAVAGPQNLAVTNDIRAQLLAAGAAANQLPVSDYTGLRPGETYYALDPATGIHWAGAALDPSPSSYQAQVAAQDDGSYFLFEKAPGGSWVAHQDGLGGIHPSTCPLPLPAAILVLWHWPAGTCRPPPI